MKFHRPERVSNLILEYLNDLVLRDVETPGALATITDVEVAKDLVRAVVKISVLPSEKSEEVLKIFKQQERELQFRLGRKLNIRPMPHISFEIDYGLQRAAAVEKALLKDNNVS